MLPKNIGFIDQLVRGLIIVDLLIPCLLGIVSGPLLYLFVTLSVVLGFSCLTGFCPCYGAFKFSTRREWD
ncbi:hypothetical protein GCM10023187_19440 [Nibrella viscosa]|uniref:Inner membrane protein YgaP-like transmembrane domain-containing protein n=1 Tax=Nibrella viscosa TaxID=1084524 RepID=A0ABP8KBH7_9BACT